MQPVNPNSIYASADVPRDLPARSCQWGKLCTSMSAFRHTLRNGKSTELCHAHSAMFERANKNMIAAARRADKRCADDTNKRLVVAKRRLGILPGIVREPRVYERPRRQRRDRSAP